MAFDRKTVDRRTFLKVGAASSGGVVAGCRPAEESEAPPASFEIGCRPLGSTGLEVSELSFREA